MPKITFTKGDFYNYICGKSIMRIENNKVLSISFDHVEIWLGGTLNVKIEQ